VILCIAGAATALIAYRSERKADEVVRLTLDAVGRKAGDPRAGQARREALHALDGALVLNPDSNLEVQRALFLEPRRRDAEALMRKLIRREPENVFLWLSLSNLRESRGDVAGAGRAFGRAAELDPRIESR
jgi:Flp pilus assembly protein TadD